jgi:hypothetical protein
MLLVSSSRGRPHEGFPLPQKLLIVIILTRGSSRGSSPREAYRPRDGFTPCRCWWAVARVQEQVGHGIPKATTPTVAPGALASMHRERRVRGPKRCRAKAMARGSTRRRARRGRDCWADRGMDPHHGDQTASDRVPLGASTNTLTACPREPLQSLLKAEPGAEEFSTRFIRHRICSESFTSSSSCPCVELLTTLAPDSNRRHGTEEEP